MSTRRLRIRSTQAPAGRPITRNAAYSAAVSTPISHSVAASCWTAKIGSARAVSCAPSWPRASPVQSRRKSGWCTSERLGRQWSVGAHATSIGRLIGKCQSLWEDRRMTEPAPARRHGRRRRRRAGPGEHAAHPDPAAVPRRAAHQPGDRTAARPQPGDRPAPRPHARRPGLPRRRAGPPGGPRVTRGAVPRHPASRGAPRAGPGMSRILIDTFLEEVALVDPQEVLATRLGLRLDATASRSCDAGAARSSRSSRRDRPTRTAPPTPCSGRCTRT